MPTVALAYSGGLDTSVAIRWMKERYDMDVYAVAIDLGEERDYDGIRQKALDIGAIGAEVIDAKEEFARGFIFPALKANACYEDRYPLSTSLARPLIAKLVGEVASARRPTPSPTAPPARATTRSASRSPGPASSPSSSSSPPSATGA